MMTSAIALTAFFNGDPKRLPDRYYDLDEKSYPGDFRIKDLADGERSKGRRVIVQVVDGCKIYYSINSDMLYKYAMQVRFRDKKEFNMTQEEVCKKFGQIICIDAQGNYQ
jgi:hypothetical protein